MISLPNSSILYSFFPHSYSVMHALTLFFCSLPCLSLVVKLVLLILFQGGVDFTSLYPLLCGSLHQSTSHTYSHNITVPWFSHYKMGSRPTAGGGKHSLWASLHLKQKRQALYMAAKAPPNITAGEGEAVLLVALRRVVLLVSLPTLLAQGPPEAVSSTDGGSAMLCVRMRVVQGLTQPGLDPTSPALLQPYLASCLHNQPFPMEAQLKGKILHWSQHKQVCLL